MFLCCLCIIESRFGDNTSFSVISASEKRHDIPIKKNELRLVKLDPDASVMLVLAGNQKIKNQEVVLHNTDDAYFKVKTDSGNGNVTIVRREVDPACNEFYIARERSLANDTEITNITEECEKHPYRQVCTDYCRHSFNESFCRYICHKVPTESFCNLTCRGIECRLGEYMFPKITEQYAMKIEQCQDNATAEHCAEICTLYSYLPVCKLYKCGIRYVGEDHAETYYKFHPQLYPVHHMWNYKSRRWMYGNLLDHTFGTDYDRFNITQVTTLTGKVPGVSLHTLVMPVVALVLFFIVLVALSTGFVLTKKEVAAQSPVKMV